VPPATSAIESTTPSVAAKAHTANRAQQKYRLENFIGVKNSALPMLVSRQFVDELSNPLYHKLSFFGAKGNGKTHLLKGIQSALHTQFETISVRYLTAESFTNGYVHAIQSKQYNAFQKKYNGLDVLILDDIQFLAGKTKTQEGLLSTVKHLESEGHSLVFASDRHPNDIPGLCPNLREFITSGMVVEVPAPCYEGRMAILKSLCCKSFHECPDTVLTFLAEHFSASVRELEGALLKVMAYASLRKRPASIELARQILQPHLVRSTAKKNDLQQMINDVAAIFSADPADITSRKQDRSTVRSRQLAMYVIRRITDKSYQEIGTIFGGKKYSAVMYAEKVAQKTIDNDPHVARHINAILKRYT
jgi:chromosomal replication initiator protein